MFASLSIGIDPMLDLGPVKLAWHGLFVAVGLGTGLLIARRVAQRAGLDRDVVGTLVMICALAGIVGSRVLYLAEHGQLADPGQWIGTRGFSFYGALVLAPIAVFVYLRRTGVAVEHLDALAWGFPLASAVGRLGDLINGEHYGPPTDLPWGIRYTHPDAPTPDPEVAYQPGGLYEVVLGIAVALLMWVLRHRLREPLDALWAAIGLYSAGRLAMFSYRSDSPDAVAGLDVSQLISLALIAAAIAGHVYGRRRRLARAKAA